MSTNGERVTKITSDSGATGFIPEAMPVDAVQGLLEHINASASTNLDEIRRLYGEQTYQRVLNNPSEAASILRARQEPDQST